MLEKSKEYLDLINIYKELHKHGVNKEKSENTFDGKSLKDYIIAIKQLIDKYNCKSIIDFGCGKAKLYNENPAAINMKPN